MNNTNDDLTAQPQSDEYASDWEAARNTDGDDVSEYDGEQDEPWDGFRSDAEADADVLASAGMGTDEDYGYYGGDEDYV